MKKLRVPVIILLTTILALGLIGIGCSTYSDRRNAEANLQFAKNNEISVQYTGQAELERAKAAADKVREQAAAEAFVMRAEVRQQMLLLEEARKDASHRRWQENLITLSVFSSTFSLVAIAAFLTWSVSQERKRDQAREEAESRRERVQEEADRRYWHAMAQIGRR